MPSARRPTLFLLAALGVLLAALLVAGCGGGGTETVTQVDTVTVSTDTVTDDTVDTATDDTVQTITEDTTPTDAAPPVEQLTAFQSPSGNIACILSARNVRCDILKKDYPDPQTPSNCPLEYGDSLTVGPSGPATFACHGDTTMNPGAPVLAYGDSAGKGPFVCVSAETGVKCTNTQTGHGFDLSRQAATPF